MVLFQNATPVKKNNSFLKSAISTPKNEKQALLIRAATDSTKMYPLAPTGSFLNLSQPILINKDSFYIKGNGITITCDSGYRGPAIIINKTVKAVVLDSIVFKNFDVTIVVQRNNIVFKNVRFINCRVPLQYQLSLPDTVISGHVKDSIFITLPSIKNTK